MRSPQIPASIQLPDETATLELAHRLARRLPADAAPAVLYLTGTLGAGKTTFARGMLQQLGESGPVRSPTYGLLAEYAPPGGRVVHLDLYRLRDAGELTALGLADLLPESRLWLVEWPDRGAGGGLPSPDLILHLEPEAGGRRASLEAHSGTGKLWLADGFADAG